MTKTTASPKKARGMLLTILAVSGVVAYVMLVFLPVQKSIQAKRREVREKQQFIQNANLKSATVGMLEEQLQRAKEHVDEWREHGKLESGGVPLLGELASLAAQSGVILHRLTPQEPANLATLRQHTLNIEVEGSYTQVFEFLRGVELRPETIWIPQLEMQPAVEDGPNVQCALSVVIFADNRGNSG